MRLALTVLVVCLLAVALISSRVNDRPALAKVKETNSTQATAVEDDMHEFMEYVFQPPYKRLKAALASEPADKNAWKLITSDSLILAESSNLLLSRVPKADGEDWINHATAVRAAGSEFYQAAKKRDYAAVRSSFGTMLTKCNACHEQFEEGKHILTP